MGIIYCFTNKINGKKYIGQTRNPKDRYLSHIHYDMNNKNSPGYNLPLPRAMRKYGLDNFEYEILAKDIEDDDTLNSLEEYYIKKFESLITQHGYNIRTGGMAGKNCIPKNDETKKKLSKAHAALSEDEIIELRIAYKNHESPKKIFEEKYKGQMHYNSFLNIWTGQRYAYILPEYIQNGRMTKINFEQAQEIRRLYFEEGRTYAELGKQYGVWETTIQQIIKNKTHKRPKYSVETITESGE